jgi:hypothetical protein
MATNEILKFAETTISILSQAAYEALIDAGHVAGVASSAFENKALKQSSLIAAGVAQFIADNQGNDIVDTLTPQNVADYLLVAILANVDSAPDWSTTVKGIGKLATPAEAQAYSSPSVAITPSTMNAAFQGANQSLIEQNGFQKFPGGLFKKWGYLNIENDGTGGHVSEVTLDFSLSGGAFVFACYNIQLTMQQALGATSGTNNPYWDAKTNSQVNIGIDGGNSAIRTYRVDWKAIGV